MLVTVCKASLTVRRMADENEDKDGAGAGDKGKDGAGDAGDKSKGKAGDGAGGAGDKGKGGSDEKTYTQAEYDAAVAEARQSARKGKTKSTSAKATRKTEGSDEEEDSAEVTEARKRAETAEAQLRIRDARDAVESAAKTAGFSNPAKIYRLLKDDLSFDESGKPENVKDLITIAKRDFPEELEQKANGSADGGAGGRAGVGTNMNDIIRRAAGRA